MDRANGFRGYWETVDRLGKDRNPYRAGYLQLVAISESDASAEAEYAEAASYFYHRCLHVPEHFFAAPGYMTPKSAASSPPPAAALPALGNLSKAQTVKNASLPVAHRRRRAGDHVAAGESSRPRCAAAARDRRSCSCTARAGPSATLRSSPTSRRFTVYPPAHPGFGLSEGVEHLDDVHDLALYYLDFLDELGSADPISSATRSAA